MAEGRGREVGVLGGLIRQHLLSRALPSFRIHNLGGKLIKYAAGFSSTRLGKLLQGGQATPPHKKKQTANRAARGSSTGTSDPILSRTHGVVSENVRCKEKDKRNGNTGVNGKMTLGRTVLVCNVHVRYYASAI